MSATARTALHRGYVLLVTHGARHGGGVDDSQLGWLCLLRPFGIPLEKKKKRNSLSASCSDYKQHCRSTAGYFLLLAMWVNVRSLRLERPTPRALHWRKETRSAVEARAR